MALLSGRRYRLEIQEFESNQVFELSQERIDINIKQSMLSIPNTAEITIYNPENFIIEALKKKYTRVSVQVGYKDSPLGTIFIGEVINYLPDKAGPDFLCSFTAMDGNRNWTEATINKTFGPNVGVNEVIDELIATFGLPKGSVSTIENIKNRTLGQTLSGSTVTFMDDLAEEFNFDWSIQDGQIDVVQDTAAKFPNRVTLLTEETGLILEPTVIVPNLVMATSLMNANLKPYRLFKLETQTAKLQIGNLFFTRTQRLTPEGTYKVMEATHQGTNYSNEWFTTVKGILI